MSTPPFRTTGTDLPGREPRASAPGGPLTGTVPEHGGHDRCSGMLGRGAAPTTEPMTPYEVATGFPLGAPGAGTRRRRKSRGSPAQALAVLDTSVLAALRRPPCVVMFSGGRDSSALLAVAVQAARREGLPLPLPFTMRFPNEPETHEARYQELVIDHLGIRDWVRADATEDADLLGPVAQRVLRRHGVVWPPLLATRSGHMALAAGGSLLSGEGGDEVFAAYRSTTIVRLASNWRSRRVPGLTKTAAGALLPRRERASRLRAHFADELGLDWLQPEVRSEYLGRLAEQWAAQPLPWAQCISWVTKSRHVRLGIANISALAAECGAVYDAPLLSDRFVEAVGDAFGLLGPPGRTAAMQAVFGHLLPAEVLARTTKAVFTLPAWGRSTREFVAGWSGQGLDKDLVDVTALRRHWCGPRPNAMTFGLLQAAWLAGR